MPFNSFDELINMATNNPKMARMKVANAKRKKIPVVDENNPGYNIPVKKNLGVPRKGKYTNPGMKRAINRRIGTVKRNVVNIPQTKQNAPDVPARNRAINKRMSVARGRDETSTPPSSEKKAVMRRKTVGY